MEFRRLRYFVAVADAGNFHRAAEQLRVAQSALSRHIRELERETGIALLERLPRGVRPTDAGRLLLTDARRILADVQQVMERTAHMARGDLGQLHVAQNDIAARNRTVRDAVREFRNRSPGIGLEMIGMSSSQQLDALRDGRLDAGFLVDCPAEEKVFDHHPIAADRFTLALPRSHKLAARSHLRLADLADQPFVCIARSVNWQPMARLMAACEARGQPLNVVQEVANEWMQVSLVSQGFGLGFVSRTMRHQLPDNVVLRLVRDLPVPMRLDLVWRRGNASPALARFIEAVRAMLARRTPARPVQRASDKRR